MKRILRFLAAGGAEAVASAAGTGVVLDAGGRGCISVEARALRRLLADGIVRLQGTAVELTDAGRASRRRGEAPADPFQARHRSLETRRIQLDDGPAPALVNVDESPLGALARRKGKDGRPLLSAREVAAGERLRADYTRGQIMPRLGANWTASVASGPRDGRTGGLADLTDAALAARLRVEKALEAVGPELSGVLVDVCCFLKGLETVELERGWPARSAKLLLRTALGALARHYEPVSAGPSRARIFHWGGDGYRPQLPPR